jgi:hypothetical protein
VLAENSYSTPHNIAPRTRQSELTGPGVGWSSGDRRLYAASLPVASTSFGLTDIVGYDSLFRTMGRPKLY